MPFPVSFGYGSTTNFDWKHAARGAISCIAASDIFAGTPVTLQASAIGSSSLSLNAGFAVRMCGSQNDQPLGIAADNAAAGQAVAVLDQPNYPRLVVSGSVNAAMQIGVINTSSAVHPLSAVVTTYPVLGQVQAGSTSNQGGLVASAIPSSYNAVWAIGQTFEPGNPGQGVVVQIAPRLLSGLA